MSRWVVVILSFVNGAYMLLDGLFVQFKGKYIGPSKPGPWAALFEKMGINVFSLGPLFMSFGIAWLVLCTGFVLRQSWTYPAGIVMALLTLWYLPVGTLLSIFVLLLLLFAKNRIV